MVSSSGSSSPSVSKPVVTEACADRSEEAAPLLGEPATTTNYGLAIEREFEVHDIGISVDVGDCEDMFSFRKLLRFAGPGFAIRGIRIPLWLICELAIIGSDIQEAIGTAIALYLLFGIEIWVGILIAALLSYVILGIQRFGARKVEALFVAMIAVMCACFGVEVLMAKPDVAKIIDGLLVPRIPANATVQAVGIVGAVIMPHNLFLHSALVGTRRIKRGEDVRKASIREANFYTTIESAVALLFSFIINATILIVFADIYSMDRGNSAIGTVVEEHLPGLIEAAELLRGAFGNIGPLLWAIGLLSSGQSSTATGTMAGQYLMEGMMRMRVSPWLRLFISRSISLVPTILIGVLATSYLDQLDEWLNVLQSLALPFALIPTLKLAQSHAIMTSDFATSKYWRAFGWATAAAIIALNVYLLLPLVFMLAARGILSACFAYASFGLYLFFVGVLALDGTD
ncbi:hypothetical protein H4S04_005088 [Coemansia sp. S16]|nr:hypothetical protein GGI14_005332 [Coemansia sp. S680]KAJ2046361.1 hypothetical protein H4S04_005088 [Coemansia sp. S16]